MLADPRQLHHFADFGYRHDTFFQCPTNAPHGQLLGSETLGKYQTPWAPEREGGIGCRCECDGRKSHNYNAYCLARLKEPNSMYRPSTLEGVLNWFT
jgi:mannosyltransferase